MPLETGGDGTFAYSGYARPFTTAGFSPPMPAVTQTSIGLPLRFRGLVQGANALFAVGENGTIVSAPGTSGPWRRLESGTTANLVAGSFAGNTLYIVGENETVLQSEPLYGSRLANISTRGQIGAAAGILTSGFVVTGTTRKSFLLRGVGPGLSGFGLSNALPAAMLTLLDDAGRPIASNSGWANDAAIAGAAPRVGAFPFAPGSADAALLVSLDPGKYTLQVAGRNGSAGLGLVEVYDADGLAVETARAVNISTLGFVGRDADALFAGFNISGAASRRVLIRAVGPSLAAFGVDGRLPAPVLELYQGSTVAATAQGPWSSQSNADELRASFSLAGAFALVENSSDAAMVTTLQPGNWTVKVSGVSGGTGNALVEVYDLP